MKTVKKFYRMLFILLCCLFTCPSCIMDTPSNELYVFSTNYTVEEQIARIETKTREVFNADIFDGTLKNYKVDIVYSIDDNVPEAFVVELEYYKEKGYYRGKTFGCVYPEEYDYFSSKYAHLIGYIRDDVFYSEYVHEEGNRIRQCVLPGRSPYSYKGFWDKKKYYGKGLFGVEQNGEMLILADERKCQVRLGYEDHIHLENGTDIIDCPVGGILAKDDYKKYGCSLTHPLRVRYEAGAVVENHRIC